MTKMTMVMAEVTITSGNPGEPILDGLGNITIIFGELWRSTGYILQFNGVAMPRDRDSISVLARHVTLMLVCHNSMIWKNDKESDILGVQSRETFIVITSKANFNILPSSATSRKRKEKGTEFRRFCLNARTRRFILNLNERKTDHNFSLSNLPPPCLFLRHSSIDHLRCSYLGFQRQNPRHM